MKTPAPATVQISVPMKLTHDPNQPEHTVFHIMSEHKATATNHLTGKPIARILSEINGDTSIEMVQEDLRYTLSVKELITALQDALV